MKLTETELAQLYHQYTAQHPPAACPSAENLTRAAMGEMNSSEREQLANHLSACPTCGEEYQLILSLKPWATQAAARIRPAAAEAPRQVIASQPGWFDWLRSIFTMPALPYATAAMLLLVTSLLAYKLVAMRQETEQLIASARTTEAQAKGAQTTIEQVNEELQRTRQQLQEANHQAQLAAAQIAKLRSDENTLRRQAEAVAQPQANVHIADLLPRDMSRGSNTGGQQQIQIPATSNVVTLILTVAGQPDFSAYNLEVLNQQGRVIYQGQGLSKTPENTFTIALPRPLLPAGQYQFKLYGARNGQSHLMQEYSAQFGYR